jgi:hypothetical protein
LKNGSVDWADQEVIVSELKKPAQKPLPAFMNLAALPQEIAMKKPRKMSNLIMVENKKPRTRLMSEQVD